MHKTVEKTFAKKAYCLAPADGGCHGARPDAAASHLRGTLPVHFVNRP